MVPRVRLNRISLCGRMVQVIKAPQRTASRRAGTGRGLIRTQTLFDGNSRMFQMIDDRGATTDYSFDTLDRQVGIEFADGSTRITAYDTASDVITYTDENGSIFNNTWDCLGRKTNVAITPASGIGGTTSQTFQYDGLNRPTLNQDITSSGTVQVTFHYDSLGRSLEEAPVILGTGSRYVTNTAFVSAPATQFTYPNSRQVNSNYDVLYRRRQIIEAATSAVIATWQFYGPGRIAEVVLANGITQSYLNNARTNSSVQSGVANPSWGNNSSDRLGYDGSGRNITKRYLNSTLNAQNGYANTTALVGNTTAYDRAGSKFYERALQAEERDNLYQPVDGSGNIATPAPGYDSVNRLLQYQRGTLASTGGYQNTGGGSVSTAITLPNTDQSRNYALDGLGNWRATGFTPVGSSARVDQRNHNYVNEITQRTLTDGGAITFQYDGTTGASNGNLKNDGTLIYFYDAFNRAIQINRVSDGLVIATYLYDAMNRRVRKTITNGGLTGNVPNGTTDYIYMGNQVMEESSTSNTPIRQFVWGTYIDECIQLTTLIPLGPQNLSTGSYYLLQDLLYRAAALANASGAIVEAYDTDAYGNSIIFTGPGADGIWFTDGDTQSSYGANEIIYCGYRYDPESELYYVRNRTYNPPLGRWIQRDPIGYASGVNLYEYVGGRAVTEADPAGLASGACPGSGQGIETADSPAGAKPCPPWGPPYPPNVKISMTVKYALWGRPPGLCALVLPTALANCHAKLGWQGFLGFGCDGFKLLLKHLGYDHPCHAASSALASAQKAKKQLEYYLPCPKGKKCCDKRAFTGRHPVDITLVVSTPGCTLTAELSGILTSKGYTGSCK